MHASGSCESVTMELNKNYQVYSEDEDEDHPQSNLLARICSCLFLYTIGSCRYFSITSNSLSRKDRVELRSLWKSQDAIYRDTTEDHWKNKTRKADCLMRKRIQHHFQDHIRKWKDSERPRFPWKMILHLLLVIVVTIQVSFYAVEKFNLTTVLLENTKLYDDLFIEKDILYTLDDVYKEIEHVADIYFTIREQSLSFMYYIENGSANLNATRLPMVIEFVDVDDCSIKKINTFSKEFQEAFPTTVRDQTATIYQDLYQYNPEESGADSELISCDNTSYDFCSVSQCNYNITQQVKCFINGKNIFAIARIRFDFTLGAFYKTGIIESNNAVDTEFFLEVLFKNELHSSHILVEVKLDTLLKRFCNDDLIPITALDIIVLIFSILSSANYVISIYKSAKLAGDVKLHFLAYHRKKLGWRQLNLLFNKWYVMMLFTCLLLVITTILKIISEYTEQISLSLIESVTVLFGFGIFLLYCGLFGFLRYFESLNVLLITLTLALPSFLRFAVCMIILFVAFTICGWVVIGPCNKGFSDPLKASEHLIGLLNGDEIINTFQSFNNDSLSIGVSTFSRIYLILFIFIFIYIVLSLFIGIIDHAYDSLSDNWKERSRGFLWDWADDKPDVDLTKSYPFPVPRISNLSSEFAIPSCDSELNSSSSQIAMKDSSTAPIMDEKSQFPLIQTESSDSEKPVRSRAKTLSHSSSDLQLFQEVCKPKITSNPHFLSGNNNSNTLSLPRHTRGITYRRAARHFTVIKSIVAEPPDANQNDVSKARFKLRVTNQASHEANALEESDV